MKPSLGQRRMGEDFFAHFTPNKELIYKIYNQLNKLDIDKPNNLIKNWSNS